MRRVLVVLITMSMLTISCSNSKKDNKLFEQDVNYWINKKLLIPKNDSNLEDHKIVNYVNGTCPKCVTNLKSWNPLIDELDSRGVSVSLLFFIYSHDYDLTEKILNSINFKGKVVFDKKNAFCNSNGLSSFEDTFHTFLLDKDNKVILVGNPILNEQIKELYINVLETTF